MQNQFRCIESKSKLLHLIERHTKFWSQDYQKIEDLEIALKYQEQLRPQIKHGYKYTSSVKFLIDHAKCLNDLIIASNGNPISTPLHEHLRKMLDSDDRDFVKQENENSLSLRNYLEDLQGHYSRLLAVRVDLSYKSEFHNLITIDKFHAEINLFLRRLTNKKGCFKHLHGYVWALEQGEDKGYHCHLLLLYDGSKRHKDCHLGQEVGEHWQILTGGYGQYFNCNDPHHLKTFIESGKCGLGMIYRKNDEQVRNLNHVAQYLTRSTKLNQRLLVKAPGMRSFGRGVFNIRKRRGINR